MRVIWNRIYRTVAITIIIFGLIFITLSAFGIITVARGHGDSMRPTLADGELYLVAKVDSDRIQRGDIVSAQLEDGTLITKRVIGLPGESISIGYSTIFVDGIDWIEEPYLEYPGWNDFGEHDIELTLEADEFYLMGDNRAESWSGIVKSEQIKGMIIK